MKKQLEKVLIPISAIGVLLMMVVWMAGGFADKISPSLLGAQTVEDDDYYLVQSNKVNSFEPISGAVTAKEATIISARTIARIESINVRAGEVVEQGQLLVSLEQKDVQAQVAQAKQQVRALSVRLAEAKKNLERTRNLRKKNLVSEFILDKEQANTDALSAELIAAKQALSHAQTVLSYNALTSPINGVVIDRFAEPGDTAQPGKMLLTLYNPNSLQVSAQIREALAVKLYKGQAINVELTSINKTVSAVVEEVVPAVNTASRSFLVKLTMPAEQGLLPGMYAKVLLPTGDKQTILLPSERVANVGQLTMVWVLDNQEKQRRLIRIAPQQQQSDMVEVISGLKVGDKVLKVN